MKKKLTTTLPKDMVDFCKTNHINMSKMLNEALLASNEPKQEYVKVTLSIDAEVDTKNKDCAYLLRRAISEAMENHQ